MIDRGFKKLKGKTIKDIKVDAINSVRILCSDGTVFTLDTDETHMGIGIASLTREKEKLEAFPKPTRAKQVSTAMIPPVSSYPSNAWPFPIYESMHPSKTVDLPLKK